MIVRKFAALALLAGSMGVLVLHAQEDKPLKNKDDDRRDLTLLRRVTESTFVHEASRITLTIPKGWKEIRPQRLTRELEPRTSTAMGIELTDRKVVATIYWLPMQAGAKLADLIRDKETAGSYGEEYETLLTIYGKENIKAPEKRVYNGRTVYKVGIVGGPDRENKYDGVLYAFEVEGVEGKWLIKIRVSYPKPGKTDPANVNEQYAEQVINSLSDIPTAVRKGDLSKEPALPLPKEAMKETPK
jgi:hypothetical protein